MTAFPYSERVVVTKKHLIGMLLHYLDRQAGRQAGCFIVIGPGLPADDYFPPCPEGT